MLKMKIGKRQIKKVQRTGIPVKFRRHKGKATRDETLMMGGSEEGGSEGGGSDSGWWRIWVVATGVDGDNRCW